jgi:hypothetical protein
MTAWTLALDIATTVLLLVLITTPIRRRLGWLTFVERFAEHERAHWRKIAAALQKRARDEIYLVDRVLLVTDDLIRVEPERAESLEVAKMELLKLRADLADEQAMSVLMETPVRSVHRVWRLNRARTRRHRDEDTNDQRP